MLLTFLPIYKTKIWGGRALVQQLHRQDLPEGNIGESWEVAAHNEGQSIINNGQHRGQTLKSFFQNHKALFGDKCDKYNEFPLLIKFISAADDLSVQVHPDDQYAKVNENDNGKVEAWYLLECDEEARLIYGLKNHIDKEALTWAINKNCVLDTLNVLSVKKDEVYYIPAGTVHAIGKGNLLIEIQQNSDLTYRVYDYDRVDVNGQKRTLHIKKSLDVIKFGIEEQMNLVPKYVINSEYKVTQYINCDYFALDILEINAPFQYALQFDSFEIFVVISGEITLFANSSKENVKMQKGDVALLTIEESYHIEGNGKILRTFAN